MQMSDKNFFGCVFAALSVQFLLGATFVYTPLDQVEIYLAFAISGVLSYLAVLTFINTREHWSAKTWTIALYMAFGLLLVHAMSNAYKHPLVILHSVNLVLTATALVRFKNWRKRQTYDHIYTVGFVTFLACALIMVLRKDMINAEEFEATKNAHVFVFIATIEVILIHILSNIKLLKTTSTEGAKLNSRVQFQNDLISIISHNIRTPLSHIYTKLEIEKMRSTPENNALIEDLSESVQHLVNIVETTLDNRDVISQANVSKPVKELLDTLNNLYGQKIFLTQNGVEPRHNVENYTPVLFGLQNFIDNAIKWSENEKPSVFLKIKEDKLFTIVADRGPGMSLERLKLYGNPVITNGPRSGKGLGIYFTIGLITTLGYDVLVKTAEGKGTIVMVFENATNNYNAFMEKGWVYKYFPAFAKDEAIIEDLTSSAIPARQFSKAAKIFSK